MDEQEFTAWAAGVERRLLRSAYLLTGDLHCSEDLVQEALVKVALRWDRLRDGNPTAYACTIVVRDHISWWRRRGREVPVEGPFGAAAVSSDPDTAMVVRRALQRLTPAQRAVVVLRHFDDLSVEETAALLRIAPGTVKSQNATGAVVESADWGHPDVLTDWAGGVRRRIDMSPTGRLSWVQADADTVVGTSYENGPFAVYVAERFDLAPLHVLRVRDHEANYSNGGLSVVGLLTDGTVLLRVAVFGEPGMSWRLVAWDPDTDALSIVTRADGTVPLRSLAADLLG